MAKGYYRIEEKAKRYYGTTTCPSLAGYMLPDGSLLNFSYEGYQRDMDHREINQFYQGKRTDCCGTTYMLKFMRRGNIRCMCSSDCLGFEFSRVPTKEQWLQIKDFYIESERYGYDFFIEHCRRDGTTRNMDWDSFVSYLDRYADYYLS